jgi:YVTN family beta-propeller protein
MITITTTDSSTVTQTATVPMTENDILQFVGATVKDLGSAGIAVDATFRNLSPSLERAILNATAYPAKSSAEQGGEGDPSSAICCPIVHSFSTNGSIGAFTRVNFTGHSQVNASIIFPRLAPRQVFWVEVVATSLNQEVSLSQVAHLLLETVTVPGGAVNACGGQEAAGPLFSDPDNGLVYVVNIGTDAVSVIDGKTANLVATISLPGSETHLQFVLYDPESRQLYLGDSSSGQYFSIDTSSNLISGTLSASQLPKQARTGGIYDASVGVYDPDNGLAYSVANARFLIITDASTNAVKANVTLPPAPTGSMAVSYQYRPSLYDPSNKEVYVFGMDFFDGGDAFNPDRLLAISTANNSVVATIPVAAVGGGLVIEEPFFSYDSSTGNILATTSLNRSNGAMGLLQISNKNAVISQLTLPGLPFGIDMAFDPNSRLLSVAQGPASVELVNSTSGASVAKATFGTCKFVTLTP